jgi:isochorismate synthase
LLARRSGPLAATVALAGSARRSADPAVDDHLGEGLMRSGKNRAEHEIVVERIRRELEPISVWVECQDEPSLARISNIQHLATPIRAQLASGTSVISLVSRLHPTPAVGGEPATPALDAIARIERMDRGWYAGPVGWMDFSGDGEFCVALRSALLRDRTATLFAGAGVVADSEPAAELAETELKLDALLPLLS